MSPNVEKEIVTQVQKVQRVLSRINPRRNILRDSTDQIENKMKINIYRQSLKKSTREKQQIAYKEIPI